MGFDHDAGTYVPCSDRVDPHSSQESERRLSSSSTHCQAGPETAGSDGSCVQRDICWPAVHETPTVVVQDQGVLPEGKPTPHTPCRRVTLAIDAFLTGWGAVMSGHPARGLWSGRHLTWHINCLEMLASVSSTETLPPGPKRSPCVGAHRQHSGGLLYQPPGRSVFAPPLQSGAPDPCVVPGQTHLAESSSHSWSSQYGSRHPFEAGTEARGMDASPRGGEADMESFLARLRWTCCDSGVFQCPLWFSLTHPAPLGLDALVHTWLRLSLYTLFPDRSAPGSSGESAPGRGPSAASSPVLAGPSMVLRPDFSPRWLKWRLFSPSQWADTP